MLLFCPGCGNGLIVEEGQRCHRFACNTCPYVHNITRKVRPASPESASARRLQGAPGMGRLSVRDAAPSGSARSSPPRCGPNLALGLPAPRALPALRSWQRPKGSSPFSARKTSAAAPRTPETPASPRPCVSGGEFQCTRRPQSPSRTCPCCRGLCTRGLLGVLFPWVAVPLVGPVFT